MPEIKNVLEMRFAGYTIKTTMEEVVTSNPIPAFWQDVYTSNKASSLKALQGRCKAMYGVCNMLNENDMEYMIGVALEDDTNPTEKEQLITLPAGQYVVFDTTLDELHNTYESSYKWLDENNYSIPHGLSFEFYGEDFDETKTLSLYIPIVK
jgi:predicted transcriptional regulator YdeE